uniref:Uncharacterized protein n=1 Tax=Rhizophagus irregularis (strain DAOM 181602 / DAOM 197198 / MUCL 43194) TaxID=747089 RepID=U9T8W7_RHIID
MAVPIIILLSACQRLFKDIREKSPIYGQLTKLHKNSHTGTKVESCDEDFMISERMIIQIRIRDNLGEKSRSGKSR